MGQYAAAAQRASVTADQQATNLPEVRNERRQRDPELGTDNLARSLKLALDNLADYPLRVYDVTSAQEVKGIGSTVARIIKENLFSAFPPEEPTAEELQRLQAGRTALRKAEEAKKKRAAAQDNAPRPPAQRPRTSYPPTVPVPPPAAAARQGSSPTIETAETSAAAPSGRGRKKGAAKGEKQYVPSIGSANYAFLIVLLQAQKGPERKAFLSKEDLINRTEASGLSNKPIRVEAPQGFGFQASARSFYSGWSGFKTLVNKGLVTSYSNPIKISLMEGGLALAERLYRDAVTRGKVAPVVGLSTDGPMQFQVEAPPSEAEAAAAAARVVQEAGLGSGSLPSAALRPRAGGATVAVGTAAARRAAAAVTATAAAAAVGVPRAARAPARATAAAPACPRNPLEVPLAERLGQRRQQQPMGESVFLDLAGSSSDEENERAAPRRGSGGLSTPRHGLDAVDTTAVPAGRWQRVSDEHMAMMMEMGFSDKKARKALRLSDGLENAVEIVTMISSDEEESSEEEQEERLQQLPPLPPHSAAGPAAPRLAPILPFSEQEIFGRGHVRGGSQPAQQRPRICSMPRLESQELPGSSQPPPSLPPPSNVSEPAATASNRLRVQGNTAAATAAAFVAAAGPSSFPQHVQRSRGTSPAAAVATSSSLWLRSEEVRLPPIPPGRCFSDQYEVLLLVDGREQYNRAGQSGRAASLQAHLDRMRGAGLAVEHRTLPIGDALWVARSRTNPTEEYVLDYVLERKSLTDLLASIKESSRYQTQKYYLKRSGLKNVYYLIEGDPETLPVARDHKTVKTAASNTEVIDGFRVLRTLGVTETFRMYQAMTQAIAGLYAVLTRRGGDAPTALTYDAWKSHMKDASQGETTLHDVWGRMLCEVPGLGPDSVAAILAAYPTPTSLWKAYRGALQSGITTGAGAATAEGMLAGTRLEGGRGGVGPEKARRVFQLLFANGWNLTPAPGGA